MFLRKTGYPEEGELVFCTVTNVQYNSVFVKIEEYEKQGLIHISEISPGRIRNIRDFVKEGKMIVCKVLKIDLSKGNIDLSLRRVTAIQKRKKTDERKQEQKAEKIIEMLSVKIKQPVEKIYKEVSKALLPKYDFLQYAFEDVVENGVSLEKEGVSKVYAKQLEELVREKINPKKVSIGGTISIKSYASDGINFVKKALIAAENCDKKIKITYLGAGNYGITIDAKEYKEAEEILKKATMVIEKELSSDKTSNFKFKRKEKKD